MPTQMDMRTMTQLTNHFKGPDGKVRKFSLDYIQRKMKEDLDDERMKRIKFSKKPELVREHNCDTKFFRRYIF